MRRQRTSVTFVVMAGGKGERLWPFVRAATPKVCLSSDGTRSLLRATIERLRPVWPHANWLIVTTQEQAAAVRAALPPSLRRCVLVEPQGKNTAACITLAAVTVAAHDPRRVLAVAPADHWIGDAPAFRRAMRAAIDAAVRHDTVAMIGIRPTHPHTGLGYLCAGAALTGRSSPRVFRLRRFIEKPSRAHAARLVSRPGTFWNSGTFVGAADTFLECVTEWLPDHAKHLAPIAEQLRSQNGDGVRAAGRWAARAYRRLASISFDHGVMDHVRGGLIVEGRFPWADLGSWDAWSRLARSAGQTVSVGCRNVTVVGQDRHLIATVGVDNLLIVHTPSATLVCRPDQAQAVRDVVRRVSADPRLASYR